MPLLVTRAATLHRFHASPVGHFLVGKTWIHICARPELWGVILFGRPDREDALRLVASIAAELALKTPPHASYIDARRLDGADPGAYAVLIDHAQKTYEASRRQFTQLALVCAPGLEGAMVAGFYGALPPPCPTRTFDRPEPALAWLGGARELERELEDLVAEVRGTSPIIDALRAALREALVAPDPDAVCRALGASQRTLQRRLRAAGTSFSEELVAVRLEAAERRLRESDDPLTVVALEVGFATPQHFATRFRRKHGESPSAWRARHRARQNR